MKGPYEIHSRATGKVAYLGSEFDLSELSRGAAVMVLSTVVDNHLDTLVVRGSDEESRSAREFLAESAQVRAAERDRLVGAVCAAFVALYDEDAVLFEARVRRLSDDWPELFQALDKLVRVVAEADSSAS